MTREEVKQYVLEFFKQTANKEAFVLTEEFIKAERVLGGRMSEEMNKLYKEAQGSK